MATVWYTGVIKSNGDSISFFVVDVKQTDPAGVFAPCEAWLFTNMYLLPVNRYSLRGLFNAPLPYEMTVSPSAIYAQVWRSISVPSLYIEITDQIEAVLSSL